MADADPDSSSRRQQLRALVATRLGLLSMLQSASLPLVTSAVFASVVGALLPVGLTLAGGLLSNRIAAAVADGGGHGDVGPVYAAFGLVMALFLSAQVMVPVQARLRWLVAKRVDGAVRARVMRAPLTGVDLTRLHSAEHLDAGHGPRSQVRSNSLAWLKPGQFRATRRARYPIGPSSRPRAE